MPTDLWGSIEELSDSDKVRGDLIRVPCGKAGCKKDLRILQQRKLDIYKPSCSRYLSSGIFQVQIPWDCAVRQLLLWHVWPVASSTNRARVCGTLCPWAHMNSPSASFKRASSSRISSTRSVMTLYQRDAQRRLETGVNCGHVAPDVWMLFPSNVLLPHLHRYDFGILARNYVTEMVAV